MNALDICRILLSFCFRFSLMISPLHLALAEFKDVPGREDRRFERLADLNIGALMDMSETDFDLNMCVQTADKLRAVHKVQALDFAVREANKQFSFKGNLKLGFVLLDECEIESQTISQALAFVPVPNCPLPTKVGYITPYDVIGVIGSSTSSQSIALSQILSPMEIPIVSFISTSDDLSDSSLHPYFLRTIPPDKHQFEAIVELMTHLGWSYISSVHDEDNYGLNGLVQLRKFLEAKHKCLATVQSIPEIHPEEKIMLIAQELVEKRNARAVVVITKAKHAVKLIQATESLLKNNFIWISTDSFSAEVLLMKTAENFLLGSVLLVSYVEPLPNNYTAYFDKIEGTDSANNIWFLNYWNSLKICSNCSLNWRSKPLPDSVYRIIDTVNMYANATQRLLHKCPHGDTTEGARNCLRGRKMLAELKETHQMGHTGMIRLDHNGDRVGDYTFLQVVSASEEEHNRFQIDIKVEIVAFYNPSSRNLLWKKNLTWKYLAPFQDEKTPQSVCSKPCGVQEAAIEKDVPCCWECRICRPNERVTDNGHTCEQCPVGFWPDNDTCRVIPVDSPHLTSVIGLIQTALAFILFLCCIAVLVFYVRNRDNNLIQNTSPTLSIFMLVGVSLGNITTVTFHMPPGNNMCRINFVLFCISFAFLNSSLLFRSILIASAFKLSRREKTYYCLSSPSDQTICTFGLAFIQFLLCILAIIICPTWWVRDMPQRMEKYVELSCVMLEEGVVSFFVFNVLMVLISACLVFKTRSHADNFKESSFVTWFVSITLLIWSAVIPSYFVAVYENHRISLMGVALFLIHTLALIFLFLPKIYAINNSLDKTVYTSVNDPFSSKIRSASPPIQLLSSH